MRVRNSLFVFLIFYLFACGNNEETFVISVGKKRLSEKELYALYETYKASVDSKSISKASFISQIVERIILEEESKKLGVSLTDEEVMRFLKENNIDAKKKGMAELFLLRNKVSEKLMNDVEVNEQLINEMEKNILDVQPEKYIFYQIILRTKEEALKVLNEINNGLDFSKAVEIYSISPEKTRGGLIDYLNADEIPTELLSVLRKMKKEEISGVVATPFGFHIIKLKEHIPRSQIDKRVKRERAVEQAKKVLQGDIYADWISKRKKEYGVNIKWELVEKLN